MNKEPPDKVTDKAIDKVRHRGNVQSLANYALNGSEVEEVSILTIEDREEEAKEILENELLRFITEETLDQIQQIINDYTADIKVIGAELGIEFTKQYITI